MDFVKEVLSVWQFWIVSCFSIIGYVWTNDIFEIYIGPEWVLKVIGAFIGMVVAAIIVSLIEVFILKKHTPSKDYPLHF